MCVQELRYPNRLTMNNTPCLFISLNATFTINNRIVTDSREIANGFNNNSAVIINDCVLNKVNIIKYLCVIINHKLKWCEHISYVKNKVSRGHGIIFKSRMIVDKKCLRSLYHSFVHAYLTYSIETWGSASKIHLHPLFLTQKMMVRIITFSHYLAHTQPLFLSLSILPLDKLFLNQIGIVCTSTATAYSQM